MRLAVWLVSLLALARVAHADDAARLLAAFAYTDEAKVSDARGVSLPRESAWNRAVIGRHKRTESATVGELVLMQCGRRCTGVHIGLGPVDRVELLGVVDLDGPAVELPANGMHVRDGAYWPAVDRLGKARRARYPVLVVRTWHQQVGTGATRWGKDVTGTAVEARLIMVALAGKERGRKVFDEATVDVSFVGAGTNRTFRFERPSGRGRLRIAATEAWRDDALSACLPGPPIAYAYAWKGDRYQRVGDDVRAPGCH